LGQFYPFAIREFNGWITRISYGLGGLYLCGSFLYLLFSGRKRKSGGYYRSIEGKESDVELKVSTATKDGFSEIVKYREQAEKSDTEALLSTLIEIVGEQFKAHSVLAFVYVEDQEALKLVAYHSKSAAIQEGFLFYRGQGIIGKIIESQSAYFIPHLKESHKALGYYQYPLSVQSLIAVPVFDGPKLVGAIVADSLQKQAFHPRDEVLLEKFSAIMAEMLFNIRARTSQDLNAKMFEIFYTASQRFSGFRNIEEIHEILFEMTKQLFPFNRLVYAMVDAEGNGEIKKILGNAAELKEGLVFSMNKGIYGWVYQNKKSLLIDNFSSQNQYYRFMENEKRYPYIQSLIIVPLVDSGQCKALLSIEHDQPGQYSLRERKMLETLCSNAILALTKARLFNEMEKLATVDGLTQVANHRSFQEVLDKECNRSARYHSPLSLLLMDIDYFKKFNDTYGHQTGDLVLKTVARIIQKSVRKTELVARYGGEEFAVILVESDQKGAQITAERIRSNIEKNRIKTNDQELGVTVSIGISIFSEEQTSPQKMIQMADQALYQSKERGKNCATLYDSKSSYHKVDPE